MSLFNSLGDVWGRVKSLATNREDPIGRFVNPVSMLRNDSAAIGDFSADPSLQTSYELGGATGAQMGAVPLAMGANSASDKMKAMQAKRDAFNPYAGMPPSGGILTNQPASPWGFLREPS